MGLTANRFGKQRSFVDASGVLWRVFEHVLQYDRRRQTSLVFESDGLIRRVRAFPENWYELPDEDLVVLSNAL